TCRCSWTWVLLCSLAGDPVRVPRSATPKPLPSPRSRRREDRPQRHLARSGRLLARGRLPARGDPALDHDHRPAVREAVAEARALRALALRARARAEPDAPRDAE